MRKFPILIVTCAIASIAEAAPRQKGLPAQPDPFKACDLDVRSDLREGGAWMVIRDIQIDEGRLRVSITHSSGQTLRSVPKVLYGKTDQERRQELQGYLGEMRAAVDAARKDALWFIVASTRTLLPQYRSPEGDNASPWYGILRADVGGKCIPVAYFRNILPDQLPEAAQRDLKE